MIPSNGSNRFKKMPRNKSSSIKLFANEKTTPHKTAAPSLSMLVNQAAKNRNADEAKLNARSNWMEWPRHQSY